MDYKKTALYILLAVVGVALWNAWMQDNAPTEQTKTELSTKAGASGLSIPQGVSSDETTPVSQNAATILPSSIANQVNIPAERIIHVHTDVLDVSIDRLGGNIIGSQLLKYNKTVTNKTPLSLLNDQPDSLYLAQSGIIASDQNKNTSPILFHSAQKNYHLGIGQHALTVSLQGTDASGLNVIRNYTFQPNQYAIKLDYQVTNQSTKPWTGSFYTKLKKRNTPEKSHFMGMRSYQGAAMYTPDKPYTKLPYTTLAEQNINLNVRGGWLSMQQQYFLTAWIPNQISNNTYFSRVDSTGGPSDIYTLGAVMPQFTIAPGKMIQQSATLYVGPEEASRLDVLAPYLSRTVDYGWLWFLSTPIFKLLQFIQHWVGNWGLSIILVTVIIKLLFFKFSEMGYVSMAKTRQLQPLIKAIKEKYGDDRQMVGQETMKLYKEEGINPLAGCLPMLIQFPFFIALYYMIMETVELRQAPFIFWIHDLSVRDPFYILPVIMVLGMVVQQKLSPQAVDPAQAKMMMVMPILFGVMFYSFPAGLLLYWITNTGISILQQWIIMRRYEKTHKPQSGSFRKKRA